MGYIYKIQNDVNHKIYIGLTTRETPDLRWREHKQNYDKDYNQDKHLYRAMKKYELKHFHFSILEQCPNENVKEREQFWISAYNSYKNGYNETFGGDTQPLLKKNWYQWSKDKQLITIFSSAQEAEKLTGIPSNQIRTAISRNNTAGGYYWTHGEKPIGHKDTRWKPIAQYTKEGTYITTYESATEALKKLRKNTKSSLIRQCCLGMASSAYGYVWKYIDN